MQQTFLARLKQQVKVLTGRATSIRKEADYSHKWYGNDYGGFYVHPDKLNSQSVVYSFGIGEDISFDRTLIEKHRCQVYGFDPTPKSIDWVRHQQLPSSFRFFEYGIGCKTGFVDFHLPKNKNYVSGSMIGHKNVDADNRVSVPMKCFADIITELGHDKIDILKMDIEGSEYEIIDDVLSTPVRIDQILLELHERFFANGRLKTGRLLRSLKEHGYALFAVSDTFEEISFLRIQNG